MTKIGKMLHKHAIKHFGTTDNLADIGFIMADGSFLDFSGRHYRDPKKAARYSFRIPEGRLDHPFIGEIWVDDDRKRYPWMSKTHGTYNNWVKWFQGNTGAIRFIPIGPMFDFVKFPTNDQEWAIRDILNSWPERDTVRIDISGFLGPRDRSTFASLPNDTDPEFILSVIRTMFEGLSKTRERMQNSRRRK